MIVGTVDDRFLLSAESSNLLLGLDDEVEFEVAFFYFYSSNKAFVCETFKSEVLSNRVLTASIDKKRLLYT
jgi:hypothetical protein